MRSNPYQQYANNEILTADPIKLIRLLYSGALEAVAEARTRLAHGDVKGRSAAITKAIQILTELAVSLNHEKGGELSARLAALYDYAQRRLIAANYEQIDAPLAEVEGILQTLSDAWLSVEPQHAAKVETPAVNPYEMQPAMDAGDYVSLSIAC